MTSGPITSWQIDGETMETVTDFIFLHSKITADGDCSHEIKRHLLLGRKVMPNQNSILESRDITLPTKVRLVKVFSSSHACMRELDSKESWASKNWCFLTVGLEKTLESPLDYREIQPVHPKGDQERLISRLKLQYFGHLMWRADSLKRPWSLNDLRWEKKMTEDDLVG